MVRRMCKRLARRRNAGLAELPATEPELHSDWHSEVEFERRRRITINILESIHMRDERERVAAMPWYRRRFHRLKLWLMEFRSERW
jgi:hypothetical protein